MNSSKREKTPWTKFRKKHGPKEKENGEYLFNESTTKVLENKAYPSEFMAATLFFKSRSVDWMFGSLEVATTFLLFRWLVPFPFTVFPEAFLVVFPWIQWAFFVARRSGGPKLAFHWLAVCPGWQPLWWGVISFQNFRSQKLVLYFCADFLASSELIGYIDLTDCYEIWPKCSLVISAKKGCIQFANFKITFLVKQSEYRKSLTAFRSLSATDWHYAVCLVVLASRKVGNSV